MQSNLSKEIKRHLAQYKIDTLQIIEEGFWWKNKKHYPHILPQNFYKKNIINKGFQKQLLSLINTRDLHLGFHHLNSSQALALNLFGPLVITNQIQLIGDLLQIERINSKETKFEYIENTNENTNFDFFIKSQSLNIYFEVKYTENEFSGTKEDKKHLDKYSEIYQDKLKKIASISQKDFFNNYQLWRNILYADTGFIVFVLPKFRTDLIKKVEKARILTNIPDRIKILKIEDLVENCQNKEELTNHYSEFKKKYLNFS